MTPVTESPSGSKIDIPLAREAPTEPATIMSAIGLWARRMGWIVLGVAIGVGAMHIGTRPGTAPQPTTPSKPGKSVPLHSAEEGISLVGYPVTIIARTASGEAVFEAEFIREEGKLLLRVEQRYYGVSARMDSGQEASTVIDDVRHEGGSVALHSAFGKATISKDEFVRLCGELAIRPGDTAQACMVVDCGLHPSPGARMLHSIIRPDAPPIPSSLSLTINAEEVRKNR